MQVYHRAAKSTIKSSEKSTFLHLIVKEKNNPYLTTWQQGERYSLSVKSTDKRDVHFLSWIPGEAESAIPVQGQKNEMIEFTSLITTDRRHASMENITDRNLQYDAKKQTLMLKRIKGSIYSMNCLQFTT